MTVVIADKFKGTQRVYYSYRTSCKKKFMLQLKIVDFVQSKEYFEENGGTVSDNNHFKILL